MNAPHDPSAEDAEDDERYRARVWEDTDYDVTDLVEVHPQITDYREKDDGVVVLIVDTSNEAVADDVLEACERLYPVTQADDIEEEGQQMLAPLQRLAVC